MHGHKTWSHVEAADRELAVGSLGTRHTHLLSHLAAGPGHAPGRALRLSCVLLSHP